MSIDAFEARGTWWLPDKPDAKVSGTLNFDPETGGTLSLIGSMRSWHERGVPLPGGRGRAFGGFDDRSGTYHRILGEARGERYTLEDAYQTNLSSRLGGDELETIYANQILKGAWFDQDQPLEVSGVRFQLKGLVRWVGLTGLKETFNLATDASQSRDPWTIIAASSLDDLEGITPCGRRLTLSHMLRRSGERQESLSLSQDFELRIEGTQASPLSTFTSLASDLQALVAIATNRAASFESMSFVALDDPRGDARPGMQPDLIDYFVLWRDAGRAHANKPLSGSDMLFTLVQLGGMPALERWLVVAAQYRSSVRRMVASRFDGAMYAPDRIFHRAAALDGFDRVRTATENTTFRTRITRCVELAGDPFVDLVGDVARWVEMLRVERDAAAHNLDQRQLDGVGAHYVSEAAYWLFVFCILRLIDAPADVFIRMQGRSDLNWTKHHLKRLFGT